MNTSTSIDSNKWTSANVQQFLDDVEIADIDDSTTEVSGVKVHVSTDTYHGDSHITQTLYAADQGITLVRKGLKEFSYERWVDTNWCSWQVQD